MDVLLLRDHCPLSLFDRLRCHSRAYGKAMKRRSKISSRQRKGPRRKTVKRHTAQKSRPNRSFSAPDLQEELDQRTRELSEALERQTATSEVLSVISSSPGDLQPVFATILENATRICEANFGNVYLWDGGAFYLVAAHNTPRAFADTRMREPFRPNAGHPFRSLVDTKQVFHVADIMKLPIYREGDPQIVEAVELGKMRTCLGVPMLKDDNLIGAVLVFRQEVREFTPNQIALITNFAAQAVIAIENARLLGELRQRTNDLTERTTDLTEALQQQRATSKVLQVISNSPGDPEPVFASMLENAARVCEAKFGNIFRLDHEAIRSVAALAEPEALVEFFQHGPHRPHEDDPIMRVARTKQSIHVLDFTKELAYIERNPLAVAAAELGGIRTLLVVPMLKGDVLIGAIALYRQEVRPFTVKQIALVENFAAQAVIAIENARLLSELRESLEQQTATAKVLDVISRSAFNLPAVFETVAESSVRLCGADRAFIFRFDGELLRMAASYNAAPDFVEWVAQHPIKPGRHSGSARAPLEKRTIPIPDVRADPDHVYGAKDVEAIRTTLGVPILKGDELLGVMMIYHLEVRPFTDKQIALVETFADQAAIAIENVRLFEAEQQRTRELTESLEQQTATAEVLQVISSSPGDLEPVFTEMLDSAVRICDAKFGNIYRRDGDALNIVAFSLNTPAAFAESRRGAPFRPHPKNPVGQTLAARAVVHIHDILTSEGYLAREPVSVKAVELGGIRTFLAVPMLKENEIVGAIALSRQEVRPFTDKQIELVRNFASQAVIAIENARLLSELRARTDELARSVEELRALGETSQAVNSTLDLEMVLNTIVSKAVQLSSTEAGAIYVFDEVLREFRLRATYGMDQVLISALGGVHIRIDEQNIALVLANREPIQVADLGEVARSPVHDIVLRAGFRARLAAPLFSGDDIIGLLVVRRRTSGAFLENTVDLMKTFAAQSALAIQNAQLFQEIDDKGRQLEVASKHKSQFLANMSHELRTPLNAILGYTELILDNIYGEAPERVQTNGKHLLGLINDVLDLSKIEAGQLTLSLNDYSLAELVQGVYVAVEPLASRKKLALTTKVEKSLPAGHGDERRLAQVLLNLVGNAIKFTEQGEVTIEAFASNGAFNVAVRDSGPGIAAADQQKIFGEFQQVDNTSTRQKGGTGLGLAISKRIVEMHGGRILINSQLGKGSTFTIRLPVKAGEGQPA